MKIAISIGIGRIVLTDYQAMEADNFSDWNMEETRFIDLTIEHKHLSTFSPLHCKGLIHQVLSSRFDPSTLLRTGKSNPYITTHPPKGRE